jgi:hypothetical protein
MDIDESRYGPCQTWAPQGQHDWVGEDIRVGRWLGTCMNSLVAICITRFRDSDDIGRLVENRLGDKRTIRGGTITVWFVVVPKKK